MLKTNKRIEITNVVTKNKTVIEPNIPFDPLLLGVNGNLFFDMSCDVTNVNTKNNVFFECDRLYNIADLSAV